MRKYIILFFMFISFRLIQADEVPLRTIGYKMALDSSAYQVVLKEFDSFVTISRVRETTNDQWKLKNPEYFQDKEKQIAKDDLSKIFQMISQKAGVDIWKYKGDGKYDTNFVEFYFQELEKENRIQISAKNLNTSPFRWLLDFLTIGSVDAFGD